MPYRYEAFNREAQRVSGTLPVESEQAAEQFLWDAGLTIIALKRVGKPLKLHEQLPTFFGVRTRDVITFATQLAVLIEAGVNIYTAVQLIRDQTDRPAFRDVLSQVLADISTGNSLASACASHPNVFRPLFLRLLRVGEETGRLDVMLRRVAEYMEKQLAATTKIRGAMTYPIIVLATAGLAMYILLVVALPNLIGLFKEFKAELPFVTRALLATVNFASNYGMYIGAGLLLVLALLLLYRRSSGGARRIDYFVIGLPIMGQLIVKLNVARLSDTMATLVSSGITLTEGLDLLAGITRNMALREPLQEVRADTLTGSSLSQALGRHAIFPPILVSLTRIGEETGTLESTFQTLARMYSEDADRSISGLIGLLEPATTVFVGAGIGLVAVTIISTIYSIMPQIK